MSLKRLLQITFSIVQQFGTSAFNAVVWWRKLDEVKNECTSHNFSLFAIFLPKIIKIGGNLTKFWQKQICTVFLRHGVVNWNLHEPRDTTEEAKDFQGSYAMTCQRTVYCTFKCVYTTATCVSTRKYPWKWYKMSARSTQPPALSGTGNEYQPKCGDALRLGSKGMCGSFHLWINVRMAGKTVWSLVNTCHTWALWRWVFHDKALYKFTITFLYRHKDT